MLKGVPALLRYDIIIQTIPLYSKLIVSSDKDTLDRLNEKSEKLCLRKHDKWSIVLSTIIDLSFGHRRIQM